MKFMRKGLAMFLAALLIMPTWSVSAAEPSASGDGGRQTEGEVSSVTAGEVENQTAGAAGVDSTGEDTGIMKDGGIIGDGEIIEDDTIIDDNRIIDDQTVIGDEETVDTPTAVDGDEIADDKEADALGKETAPVETTASSEVLFNTDNHAFSVVDRASFDQGNGDAFFEEDGSYTINIPEENPFFPYEVQFTYEGEVTNQWFMTPDDSVEVGGHAFHVSAYFDGTVMTQMSLDVAGNTVIVYPEEKNFINDGDGAVPASLLPLEEKSLSVDLRGFTPVELTMTSVGSIFTGSNSITDPSKVVWTYKNEDKDDYAVSMPGDRLNLAYGTSSGNSHWEMIVGEADQLADDNTRYNITLNVTSSGKWLTPTVYVQNSTGNRTNVSPWNYYYYDYARSDSYPELYINLPDSNIGNVQQVFITLEVESSLFSNTQLDSYKIYEGKFATAAEAVSGTEITTQITDTGYMLQRYSSQWVTLVAYDGSGTSIGCLPFQLYWSTTDDSTRVSMSSLRDGSGKYVYNTTSSSSDSNGCTNYTYILYKGYAANQIYYLNMNYYQMGQNNPSAITAAYAGQYTSIAQAASAGAADIKDDLFGGNGYAADYSSGVYFTIFAGADGMAQQEIYRYCVKTQEGEKPKESGTNVLFNGLKDNSGMALACYVVSSDEDSYGENNYVTILVGADVDLSSLAPTFSLSDGAKLYASGSSAEEISGVSLHDFSTGAVQYSVSAEDGKADPKNCWLQVIKASDTPRLYINSFAAKEANTYTDANGVIHSIREIMLDGYHDYRHDIFLANMSTAEIPALSAELVSDVVELDEYWRLNGEKGLSGFSTVKKDSNAPSGELPNLAKIRIRAKEGTEATEVSGTLTIKSGSTTLVVLTLTGTIGDPSITTPDIPGAVKYVPYGTMIQNNNKYNSWNQVSYWPISGKLPAGMEVKQNGEIYGVPLESGEFTFTVRMINSYSNFKPSEKTYTLTVAENTDANVDGATDGGYILEQRVQNIYLQSVIDGSQTLVSEGEFAEFKYIFLDGVKLVEGTDYTAESGSTRITILNQTLKLAGASSVGTHTLGIEFRQGDNTLQRAAQNYVIYDSVPPKSDNGKSDSNNGNGDTFIRVNQTEETIVYTVVAGDSLWKIAQKYYGSGSYWQKIYADNASTISDPNKIYVGQQITIYLKGGSSAGTTNADGTSYTVASGDTLWKIAQRIYGKGRYWKKIYEANTNIIADPSRIYIGQVLILPED